ncbi:hypothetical protein OSTOST_18771 [Ostertagia ostertagi]
MASRIVDAVYGLPEAAQQALPEEQDPVIVAPAFQIRGIAVQLTGDQQEAVRLAIGPQPIAAIQAAFGTGKTMINGSAPECRREVPSCARQSKIDRKSPSRCEQSSENLFLNTMVQCEKVVSFLCHLVELADRLHDRLWGESSQADMTALAHADSSSTEEITSSSGSSSSSSSSTSRGLDLSEEALLASDNENDESMDEPVASTLAQSMEDLSLKGWSTNPPSLAGFGAPSSFRSNRLADVPASLQSWYGTESTIKLLIDGTYEDEDVSTLPLNTDNLITVDHRPYHA